MKTRDIMLGATLTAFALVIPLAFGFLKVVLFSFEATIGSLVPLMLAITISPTVALLTGIGTAAGFFLLQGPVTGFSMLIHILWAYVGARLFAKKYSLPEILLIALPIRIIGQTLFFLFILKFNFGQALLAVGLGTALHHVIDSVIAILAYKNVRYFTRREKIKKGEQ